MAIALFSLVVYTIQEYIIVEVINQSYWIMIKVAVGLARGFIENDEFLMEAFPSIQLSVLLFTSLSPSSFIPLHVCCINSEHIWHATYGTAPYDIFTLKIKLNYFIIGVVFVVVFGCDSREKNMPLSTAQTTMSPRRKQQTLI